MIRGSKLLILIVFDGLSCCSASTCISSLFDKKAKPLLPTVKLSCV